MNNQLPYRDFPGGDPRLLNETVEPRLVALEKYWDIRKDGAALGAALSNKELTVEERDAITAYLQIGGMLQSDYPSDTLLFTLAVPESRARLHALLAAKGRK